MARIAAIVDTGAVASFIKVDPASGINLSGPQSFTTCVGPPPATPATPASSRRSAPVSSPGYSPAPKRSTCTCSREVAKLQVKLDQVLGHLRRPEPQPEASRQPEIPGLDLLSNQRRIEPSESESSTEPWYQVLVDEVAGLQPANHRGDSEEETDAEPERDPISVKQEPTDWEETGTWFVPPTEYVPSKSGKKDKKKK